MTRLKPRHERFCRSFVECTNATLAAKAAGYTPAFARNAGYRLLQRPRIVERISEIQQQTAQAHCRDVDILLGKLETIYRRAIDDRHFSAAARAVELQAKLAGLGPITTTAARARIARPPADERGGPASTEPAEPEAPLLASARTTAASTAR